GRRPGPTRSARMQNRRAARSRLSGARRRCVSTKPAGARRRAGPRCAAGSVRSSQSLPAGALAAHIGANRMRVLTLAKGGCRVGSGAKASQLAAALAYYAAFSLAPLLLISVAVAGVVFGAEAVQGRLDEQLRGALGAEAAEVLQSMVASSRRADGSAIATAV